MPDLRIRPASGTKEDVRAIYELLLGMFDEAPMQELAPDKALVEIARVCRDEAAWIVSDGERPVATAGLIQAGFWYSNDPILVTYWLYARPEHRGANGAWGMMLDEIRALSKNVDMAAYLDVCNPQKKRRSGRLEAGFARFSFDPRGARLRLASDHSEAA